MKRTRTTSVHSIDSTSFTIDDIQSNKYWFNFKLSLTGLADTYVDSRYIYRQCKAHKSWSKFHVALKNLMSLRMFWMLMAIAMELAVSFVLKNLFTALQQMDESQFAWNIKIYIVATLIASPIMAFDGFLTEKVYLTVREAVTTVLLNRYHSNNSYYHISSREDLDNPGQRMDSDLDTWSWGLPYFVFLFIEQMLRIMSWSAVLWYIGAHSVFVGFGVATVVVILGILVFASKLTAIATERSHCGSNFRAGIIRTKDNGETIAFYGASGFENQCSTNNLQSVLAAQLRYAKWEGGLKFLQQIMKYGGAILPLWLLVGLYMKGELDLGILMQSSEGFARLLRALTVIIDQIGRLSKVQAGGRRVVEVIEAMNDIEEEMYSPVQLDGTCIQSSIAGATEDTYDGVEVAYFPKRRNMKTEVSDHEEERPLLLAKDLSVIVPNSRNLLLYRLNLAIKQSQNVLIVGPSGSGKSSLFRVLSGLWKWGDGQVTRLHDEDVMFLPQRPYLPTFPAEDNTLRNQLLFPKFTGTGDPKNKRDIAIARNAVLTPEKFREVMKLLNLEYILRYGHNVDEGSRDWGKLLSLGEQQRMSFGRVLIARPQMVYLDEATSALDPENQARMYGLLLEQEIPFMSVGHRANLVEFHDTILEFTGDGNWNLQTREEYIQKSQERQTDSFGNI